MHTSRGWTLNLNWSDKKREDKELTPLFWNKFSASDFSTVVHCLFPTYLPHFLPLAITITTTSWCSLLQRVLLFLAGEKERERAGHDRKDENFPARFLFFWLLLFSQGYPAENSAEERVLDGKKHFYLQFRVWGCVRATRSLHDEVHTVASITRTLANSNPPLTDFPWISFIILL